VVREGWTNQPFSSRHVEASDTNEWGHGPFSGKAWWFAQQRPHHGYAEVDVWRRDIGVADS